MECSTNIGIYTPFVPAHNCRDMVLNDTGQGIPISDTAHPRGELRVPKEGMTPNDLPIGFRKVEYSIGCSE